MPRKKNAPEDMKRGREGAESQSAAKKKKKPPGAAAVAADDAEAIWDAIWGDTALAAWAADDRAKPDWNYFCAFKRAEIAQAHSAERARIAAVRAPIIAEANAALAEIVRGRAVGEVVLHPDLHALLYRLPYRNPFYIHRNFRTMMKFPALDISDVFNLAIFANSIYTSPDFTLVFNDVRWVSLISHDPTADDAVQFNLSRCGTTLYLSIQGTSNLQDVLADVSWGIVTDHRQIKIPSCANTYALQILRIISRTLANQRGATRLLITGHSLGGGRCPARGAPFNRSRAKAVRVPCRSRRASIRFCLANVLLQPYSSCRCHQRVVESVHQRHSMRRHCAPHACHCAQQAIHENDSSPASKPASTRASGPSLTCNGPSLTGNAPRNQPRGKGCGKGNRGCGRCPAGTR